MHRSTSSVTRKHLTSARRRRVQVVKMRRKTASGSSAAGLGRPNASRRSAGPSTVRERSSSPSRGTSSTSSMRAARRISSCGRPPCLATAPTPPGTAASSRHCKERIRGGKAEPVRRPAPQLSRHSACSALPCVRSAAVTPRSVTLALLSESCRRRPDGMRKSAAMRSASVAPRTSRFRFSRPAKGQSSMSTAAQASPEAS
mmetsp:Transcript_110961/g.237130  ORF Transcript_110961/g.237130 Transcript_110961/m.237130 type:complete len:201 (+) Transcript_110961:253-855(+)